MKKLLIVLMVSSLAMADLGDANRLQLCNKALQTCEALADAEYSYINDMKKQEEAYAEQLAAQENKPSPWLYLLIGFVVGGLIYTGVGMIK